MLVSQSIIESFFQKNNLVLSEERVIDSDTCYKLYLNAHELGYGFACFFHYGILNEEGNIATNFSSWADLYDAYTCFMIGFSKSINN